MLAKEMKGKKTAPELYSTVLTPREVEDLWEGIEPLLLKFEQRSRGEFSVELLKGLLFNQHLVAFAYFRNSRIEMLVLTHLVNLPGTTRLEIIGACGSNSKDYMPKFWPDIERYAMILGAREIRFQMTPAAERLWRARGIPLAPKFKVMACDLRSKMI